MAILCTNWNATAMPLPTGIKQAIARVATGQRGQCRILFHIAKSHPDRAATRLRASNIQR
jgi:hypothetical protein